MRWFKWSFAFLVCLIALAAAGRYVLSQQVPPGVKYDQNVVYCDLDGTKLHLDIARPMEAGPPRPCVLVIHGGAWRAGSKSDGPVKALCMQLAQRGYVAVGVQYRLVPKHRFPAQIEDVKCAVRFLRAHAKDYNLDPDRMGAAGASAGAHLAMMLGTMDAKDGFEGSGGDADQSSKVQAVVAFFGPTDFTQKNFSAVAQGLLNDFIGHLPEDKPELFKAASPITYVDKNDAPILIFQGTKDKLIPTSQATLMAEAMSKAGVNGRVELLLNADHGWQGAELTRTLEASYKFLDEHLRKE